jgi:RHS repeat-associated protein
MIIDVLGRLKQVDELNWDQSIYATTTYAYNSRDQITQSNQAGQTRSFSYDGYGRINSKTTPEQGQTNYSYFADDAVQTMTDARGVTSTYSYNNRHLVTGISYGGWAGTPNVAFGYDSAGNRTSMSDGLGSASYAYNTLSQMTSETRTFSGVGAFTLSYTYNLSGQLTGLTNPWNAVVGYNYDKAGRPSQVTGSGYAGVASYASNLTYRAFGVKGMSYANGRTLSLQYDNRMRVTRWDVPGVMGWSYAYATPLIQENTGRVAFADNLYDATLDRSYDYDHVGRMWASHTGKEGRGHAGYEAWGPPDGPYAENYSYDQFGNMTWRNGWGVVNAQYAYNPQFANNRMMVNPVTGAGMTYDAAGNLTNDGSQSFTYDATGQQTYASATGLTQSYDGDRLRAKKIESGTTTYYLRSTVLGGQVIAELNASGGWTRGYVYLGGQMLAIQSGGVSWVHQDPVTKSQRVTNSAGSVVSTIDLDPWGGETGRSSNQAFQPHRYTSYTRDANGGDDAMMRRYQVNWSRFSQPDPYDGSYSLTDPQSFNRYAYVQNDPVNFVDPTGLDLHGDLGEPPLLPGGPTASVDIPISFDDPFDDPFFRGYDWGGFLPLPVIHNDPRGGLPGGLEPQNPTPVDVSKLGPPPPTCDERLAAIFGGPGAVVGSTRDPDTLLRNAGTARPAGHGPAPFNNPDPTSSDRGGIIHIYGNPEGTATNTPLYAPSGGRVGPIRTDSQDNVYRRVSYSTGLTITFVHVIPDSGPGRRGSVRIGNIGGSDSGSPGYLHTHIVFFSDFKNRVRVDPRKLFCGR